MLTLRTIRGVREFRNSQGLGGGACFGVTDPSRLRHPIVPVPPEAPITPHKATASKKKSVPAMRPAKKKK